MVLEMSSSDRDSNKGNIQLKDLTEIMQSASNDDTERINCLVENHVCCALSDEKALL